MPGEYKYPPISASMPYPKKWYVVSRGTRVGIFPNRFVLYFLRTYRCTYALYVLAWKVVHICRVFR